MNFNVSLAIVKIKFLAEVKTGCRVLLFVIYYSNWPAVCLCKTQRRQHVCREDNKWRKKVLSFLIYRHLFAVVKISWIFCILFLRYIFFNSDLCCWQCATHPTKQPNPTACNQLRRYNHDYCCCTYLLMCIVRLLSVFFSLSLSLPFFLLSLFFGPSKWHWQQTSTLVVFVDNLVVFFLLLLHRVVV